MTASKPFSMPDESTMFTAMVLQQLKDQLEQQKSNVAVIQAQATNDFYWAMFNPSDEQQWFDNEYGDIREMPSFGNGIASEKQKVLEVLKDKSVIKRLKANETNEDPEDMGWKDYVVINSFEVEVNLTKFLKYYEKYIRAAQPALNEYLANSGRKVEEPETANQQPESLDDTATLSLNSASKTIRLTVLGKTRNVHKFRSKLDANYVIFKNLTSYPNRPMTKKELGVPRMLSSLKDIPKTMGFNGDLKSIFFTIDTKNQTLALHTKKSLTPEEVEILSSYVNSNTTQK